MLLLLDNFDSFTFNLAQYFQELGEEVRVVRNDTPLEEIARAAFSRIVISPGPGTPARAGVTPAMFGAYADKMPMLGVCLGHQAMAEHFGGRVIHAPSLVHGKTSEVSHDNRGIFAGLPEPFSATRYHSLCVDASRLPECLEVSARSADGVIMGLRHKQLPLEGVQFHPESVLTTCGKQMLANWLKLTT